MSLRRRLNGNEPMLDLTSASDIIFSLLLFFILTQNFLTTLPMVLPTVTTGEAASREQPFHIAIDASGTVSVAAERLAEPWHAALASRTSAVPRDKPVLIELDRRAPAGRAVEALDVLRQAGISRVAFVATPAPLGPQGNP